jgi:hypothetical protein
MAWNDCRCDRALYAQRFGMIEAQKKYGAGLGLLTGTTMERVERVENAADGQSVVVPPAHPEGRPQKPRRTEGVDAAPVVIEGVAFVLNEDGTAPFLQPKGICPSCDRRRSALKDTKARQREKAKPAQKRRIG